MVLASSSLQSGTTSERSSALLRALAEDILRRWGACASGTIENRGDHTGFPTALLAEGVPALLHFLVNELARSPSDDGRQFLSQWVEAVHEAGFGSEDVLNTLRVLKRSAAEVIAEVEGVPDDVTGTATRMLSDRLDETTVEISELLEQAAEREAAESQRELRQLGAIAQITAAAVSSLDVRRVFEAVAPQLPRLFKFDRLILGLVTSSGDALRLAAVWPPAEALREGTVLPLRQSALGHPILDHGPF
ncbi:MAG: hypothetical protein FJ279_23730, partial [Planctomycetes bacterium]|nr:hypothetical protein [Planctomycetota bacterium]